MAKQKATISNSGEVQITKDDMIDVVGTGKVSFMPEGKAFKVHRIAGEKLIAKGKATLLKGEAAE